MKRIIRTGISIIIANHYTYPRDSAAILVQLDIEQNNLCAYTEEYYCPGYAREVEHFDPTKKNTPGDGYDNWFSASTRFNKHKGSKARWFKYQTVLHPTSPDLEARLIYDGGYFIPSDPSDNEARNLKDYLFLNEFGLPQARIAYINELKDLFGSDLGKIRNFLIKYPHRIQYRRALETEFGIFF
jgi:hypothetical protein